jgi:adenine nucleotide transporter 17
MSLNVKVSPGYMRGCTRRCGALRPPTVSSSLLDPDEQSLTTLAAVYYYFFQRSKEAFMASRGSKSLSTIESMITGAVAGAITSTLTNPIWVIQSVQATQSMDKGKHNPDQPAPQPMTIPQTLNHILQTDGPLGLWRGLGPALIMVINPVIQYTASEQLQRWLVNRRTLRLRAAGGTAAAVLSDWDFFLLGALSKLRKDKLDVTVTCYSL